MAKFRKIKPKISKRKKLILLFAFISLLFVSGGYAILGSNVGLLGTLFVNKYRNMAVIQSFSKGDTTKFRSDTYRTKIETITLSESISPPEEYIESWNLGINGKSNVMGYITKRSGTETDIYDLYIQGDGNLYANPDSTYLFGGFEGLKEIIGLDKLNTSEVTNMSYMFAVNAFYFSGKSKLTSLYLSGFDTSKVTNMSYMFYCCNGLSSLDLSNFNTSNVTNMGRMFDSCNGLTSLNVSGFDTGKVTDMGFMFSSCSSLTSLNVSGFDTSNVTGMIQMFYKCSKLTSLDLSSFDTSKVTTMSYMFDGCNGLTSLNVSGFDTSNVTNMSYMFYYCSGLTSLDVSKFDTSKVINMGWMFSSCSSLTSLNLNNFDTHNVINMSGMFGGDINHHMKLSEITVGDNWNTQKVTDMSFLFNCFDVPISQTFLNKLDTRSVTNMQYMFQYQYYSSSLDLSGFDTSKVTNMTSMFSSCRGLTTIYAGPKWSIASVTNSTSMFSGCSKLVGQSGVAYDSTKTDASMANYDTGYLTLKCFASDLKRLAASSTVIADDGTIDHNMRYTGISPNNYVTFNGEEWRVIGSFNNVDDGTGKKTPRVKIIKSTSLEKQWHTSDVNIWKDASLNAELQASSYASNDMVDNAVWYLGDPGNGYYFTAVEAYAKERETTVAVGNDATWNGKVALMYPSDYGFASSACKDGAKSLYYYDATDVDCKGTNWLFLGSSYEWTLVPRFDVTNAARSISSTGRIALSNHVTHAYAVRPVVYLKPSVLCTNCSDESAGTKSNPFQIA